MVYTGAKLAVRADFPDSIRQRFRFLYLAEDDQREEDGTVIPGIGGGTSTSVWVSSHGRTRVNSSRHWSVTGER